MVVQGLIALALAGPTGGLFGLAYGTAIRVGYEIIYPLLFDQIARDLKAGRDTGEAKLSANTEIVIGKMNTLYTSIGGLEANAFGVNTGIKNALKQIEDDPELLELIKKNSNLLSQNITVNLSGTGLIDEKGRVVSKPPLAGLSEVEKIEAKAVVTGSIRVRSDSVCSKEYGSAFGTAGFNSEGIAVTCQRVVGGRVQERRSYPISLVEQEKKTIVTPQDRFKSAQVKADEEVKLLKLQSGEIYYYKRFLKYSMLPNPNSRNSQAWHSINVQNTRNAVPNANARQWIQKNSTWARYGVWLRSQ